jgi:hypothetical protein
MNAENKPKRLGEILMDEGVITEDQLNIALTEQKKVHEPLGKLLVNLGFATEAIMRSALGEALEQDSVDLSRVVPDPDAIKMINSDTARKHKIIPLNYDPIRSTLTIAMSDTFNLFTLTIPITRVISKSIANRWCAWWMSCFPTRSSEAPRIFTSNRKKASCVSATGLMACCARFEACTRLTGRRSQCVSRLWQT